MCACGRIAGLARMKPPDTRHALVRALGALSFLAALCTARGGGVYDEFVRIAGAGGNPGPACGSLAARLDQPAGLSSVEIMDGTACLALYGTAMENKTLADDYLARYRRLPRHDHDRALARDAIDTPCADCKSKGSTTSDCPTCVRGFITTKTTLDRRQCPGCRGAGTITTSCPTCGGDGLQFNRTQAAEAFRNFVTSTLLRRAGADAPRFAASLEPANREAFIRLYLKSLLTELQVSGRVAGVPDADRVLVFNTVTKELSCLHSPGHGLAKDVEVRRTAYAAEPWSGPGPTGELQKLPGYTTDILEAAVHAIGHDQVLDLYAAPKP